MQNIIFEKRFEVKCVDVYDKDVKYCATKSYSLSWPGHIVAVADDRQ